jgi:hypothetical protein
MSRRHLFLPCRSVKEKGIRVAFPLGDTLNPVVPIETDIGRTKLPTEPSLQLRLVVAM